MAQPTRARRQLSPSLPGGRRRGARTGGEATSCFHLLLPPPSSLERHGDARNPLVTLPLSPVPIPRLSPFPEHHRAKLVAAAHRRRSYCPRRAPLPCPTGPPSSTASPRRRSHRRTPCDDASKLVTAASAAGLCPWICVVQCLPELNDGAVRISVSPAVISPFSLGRGRPLRRSPAMAESFSPSCSFLLSLASPND